MIGRFKTNEFNANKILNFYKELNEIGINANIQWKINKEEIDPTRYAESNSVSIKLNNKLIFSQFNRNGAVRLNNIPERYYNDVMSLLAKYNFYTKPNYTPGIMLAILFIILHAVVISNNTRYPGGLITTLIITDIALIAGIIMQPMAIKPPKDSGLYHLSWVLIIPGFLMAIPSSILLLPMLNTGVQDRLYKNVISRRRKSPGQYAEESRESV